LNYTPVITCAIVIIIVVNSSHSSIVKDVDRGFAVSAALFAFYQKVNFITHTHTHGAPVVEMG